MLVHVSISSPDPVAAADEGLSKYGSEGAFKKPELHGLKK